MRHFGIVTSKKAYIDHLVSWLPHRADRNVLFVRYEDMKKNLPEAVSRIASFMGVALSNDVLTKIAKAQEYETR